MYSALFSGLLLSVFATPAPVRVVLTGDSITCGYSPYEPGALAQRPGNYQIFTVCSGGCQMGRYLGLETDPGTGTYRDFAGEVLALDPDVIVFMLGTNDAFRMTSVPTWLTDVYRPGLEQLENRFTEFVNGRNAHPKLLILTPLPILPGADETQHIAHAEAEQNAQEIRAWLSTRFGANWPVYLLDAAASIVLQPNWTAFYSSDGIHLLSSGYSWSAEEIAELVSKTASLGDLNCDGAVNGQDIDGFVLALFDEAFDFQNYYTEYPDCNPLAGDMNCDGHVNGRDIDGLVAALLGG